MSAARDGVGSFPPAVPVREECLQIHEDCPDVRMGRPQLVQDAEAVRVQVSPVQHLAGAPAVRRAGSLAMQRK